MGTRNSLIGFFAIMLVEILCVLFSIVTMFFSADGEGIFLMESFLTIAVASDFFVSTGFCLISTVVNWSSFLLNNSSGIIIANKIQAAAIQYHIGFPSFLLRRSRASSFVHAVFLSTIVSPGKLLNSSSFIFQLLLF